MPLFDYQCAECRHIFSKLRRSSERDGPLACPQCQSEKAQRLVSVFAVASGSSSGPSACSPPRSSDGFG